jgi:hypothetical protein
MLKQTNVVKMIVAIGVLSASSVLAGSAIAREDAPPKPQDRTVVVQDQEKQSVLIAGSYKSGEVSKQEFKNPVRSEQAKADNLTPSQSSSRERTFAIDGK